MTCVNSQSYEDAGLELKPRGLDSSVLTGAPHQRGGNFWLMVLNSITGCLDNQIRLGT